jgi:molybdenum cofactor guanylyltransferase
MKILGAIIAGGQSRRMGGVEKAFLQLGSKTLIEHVVARLTPQVDDVIINANGDAARFHGVVVPDAITHIQTPLVGLHAVLAYAKNYDAVLTVPSDGPFLPLDLKQKLCGGAAIACSGGQAHYLTGFWPVSLFAKLEDAILNRGLVRMQDWVLECQAAKVEWEVTPHDPFFNINTPDDVVRAEAILKSSC